MQNHDDESSFESPNRPANAARNEPMSTQTANEKARKLAARLEKRRAALVNAMQLDILDLRKIIHGGSSKDRAGSENKTS